MYVIKILNEINSFKEFSHYGIYSGKQVIIMCLNTVYYTFIVLISVFVSGMVLYSLWLYKVIISL